MNRDADPPQNVMQIKFMCLCPLKFRSAAPINVLNGGLWAASGKQSDGLVSGA